MFDKDWDEFITHFLQEEGESYILNLNKRFTRSPSYLSSGVYEERLSDYSDNIVIFFNLPGINESVTHGHEDCFELTYVYKGRCRQVINGKRMDMNAGDICLLSPRDFHSLQYESDVTVFFAVLIKKTLFEDSFLYLLDEKNLLRNFFSGSVLNTADNQSFLYFPKLEGSRAGILIRILIRESFERKMQYSRYIESTLSLLLIELERSYRQMLEEQIRCDPKIIDILIYIQKNKRTVTLAETAEHFSYHPNYLSSMIKRNTGKTFSEILSDSKMTEASYLLKYSELSIEKIIQKTGFYDNSHFHRTFKRKYGMTPAAYRESERINENRKHA